MTRRQSGIDYERICKDAGADTLIFIVRADSPLCEEMLKMLRTPGALSSSAANTFEGTWRIYRSLYANNGGVFGVLIHRWLRARGPVVAMGENSQVESITKILTLKAREVTRGTATPLVADSEFEATAFAVVAQLSTVEGHA